MLSELLRYLPAWMINHYSFERLLRGYGHGGVHDVYLGEPILSAATRTGRNQLLGILAT